MNPEIRYGSTTGGIPLQSRELHFNRWCQQLGFGRYKEHTYGIRSGYCVYGCYEYDDFRWHWCDCKGGIWYNRAFSNRNHKTDDDFITSITCE